MGVHEVTQQAYNQFLPRHRSNPVNDPTHPVGMVIWPRAIGFCQDLSQREDRGSAYREVDGQANAALRIDPDTDGYRLPTNAEWEFACRAGTSTAWHFGNDPGMVEKYAWLNTNSDRKTHPVGQKLPNAFGLYDMLGNNWEWCHDWFGEARDPAEVDPTGPESGTGRCTRGGFWISDRIQLRSGHLRFNNPHMTYPGGGFRIVRQIAKP